MFDLANNRLSYSEILQPDAGYTLDFAVGLTYSLDLEALIGVPVLLSRTTVRLMIMTFSRWVFKNIAEKILHC